MLCDYKKCAKCGMKVELTLQNKETQAIRKVDGCLIKEIYGEMRKLNENFDGLRADHQSRGNELIKGLSHSVMTNLKLLNKKQ